MNNSAKHRLFAAASSSKRAHSDGGCVANRRAVGDNNEDDDDDDLNVERKLASVSDDADESAGSQSDYFVDDYEV